MSDVRVRFAPSPTGFLHLGGARSALFNWLFARHHGGTFILRIEDTDRERSTEESVQQILADMAWLGLTWDEGPYFQSRRYGLYRAAVQRLVDSGDAYRCTCTPATLQEKREAQKEQGGRIGYDGTCRDKDLSADEVGVWRFRRPLDADTVEVDDDVQGLVVVPMAELDDFVMTRTDGSPTYNFCVVIDDADLRISHVIRGKDHLSNTPKQLLLYRALHLPVPRFAHLPLVKGLSKRKGSTAVGAWRDEGFLPDAMANYMARLGWSHGDDEIFSVERLVELFDIRDVNRASGAYDVEKLAWVNAQHIYTGDPASLAEHVSPWLAKLGVEVAPDDPRLVPAILQTRERSKTLAELADNTVFYFRPVEPEPKAAKHLRKAGPGLLGTLVDALDAVDPWDEPTLESTYRSLAERLDLGLGKLAQPARAALTGRNASPGLFELSAALGKDESMRRLRAAADKQW